MLDSIWRGGGPWYGNRQAFMASPGPGVETNPLGDPNYEMEHFCVPRHGGGARTQLVFFDGSAKAIKVRQLWAQLWHREWDQNYYVANYPLPAWLQAE